MCKGFTCDLKANRAPSNDKHLPLNRTFCNLPFQPLAYLVSVAYTPSDQKPPHPSHPLQVTPCVQAFLQAVRNQMQILIAPAIELQQLHSANSASRQCPHMLSPSSHPHASRGRLTLQSLLILSAGYARQVQALHACVQATLVRCCRGHGLQQQHSPAESSRFSFMSSPSPPTTPGKTHGHKISSNHLRTAASGSAQTSSSSILAGSNGAGVSTAQAMHDPGMVCGQVAHQNAAAGGAAALSSCLVDTLHDMLQLQSLTGVCLARVHVFLSGH